MTREELHRGRAEHVVAVAGHHMTGLRNIRVFGMWTEFEELTRTGLADNVRTAAAHEQRWLYEAASTGAKARVGGAAPGHG